MRIGVTGNGRDANAAAMALLGLPDVQVVLHDPDVETAVLRARTLSARPIAVTSSRDELADAVDGVVHCLRAGVGDTLVRDCLQDEIPVAVMEPGMVRADLVRLAQLERETGTPVMLANPARFDPTVAAARTAFARERAAGSVLLVTVPESAEGLGREALGTRARWCSVLEWLPWFVDQELLDVVPATTGRGHAVGLRFADGAVADVAGVVAPTAGDYDGARLRWRGRDGDAGTEFCLGAQPWSPGHRDRWSEARVRAMRTFVDVVTGRRALPFGVQDRLRGLDLAGTATGETFVQLASAAPARLDRVAV